MFLQEHFANLPIMCHPERSIAIACINRNAKSRDLLLGRIQFMHRVGANASPA
jgi:hypothetical protein